MRTSRSVYAALQFVILLTALVAAPACMRAAERLPGQDHNRMIYVRTREGDETFINVPDHYDVGSPSLSFDGKWIAFDANTIGNTPVRETWIVDAEGSGLRKLTNAAAPRWSSDGKRLLASRFVVLGTLSSRFDVLEVEVASGKEHVLCEGRFPDWSPDGKRIVFAKDGGHTANDGVHPGSKLYTARADGTSSEELCDGNWPSWSPDGKKIAYCVQPEGKMSEMWTIDLDTKQKTKIGTGFYRAQWAGDSKGFACNGTIPGNTALGYRQAPAQFLLERPLKPRFFSLALDNPWSPCVSRDGAKLVLIVDSQKQRGE